MQTVMVSILMEESAGRWRAFEEKYPRRVERWEYEFSPDGSILEGVFAVMRDGRRVRVGGDIEEELAYHSEGWCSSEELFGVGLCPDRCGGATQVHMPSGRIACVRCGVIAGTVERSLECERGGWR
jgi:hypothetical protein